jgi:multiple sugar transport system substrate-binding protein
VQPLDQLWSKQDQADFHPDVIKAETFAGKPYAIMFQTGMRGLVYRPSMLKTAGLDAFPTTWDDILAAGKTVKNNGMTAVLLPAKAVDEPSTMHLLSMFWGLGGSLVDDKGAPVFFKGANATALQQVFQFYRDLATSGTMLPNVTVMDEAAIRPFLYSGEVLAAAQSSSSIKQIWTDVPDTKGDLAVANYPMPKGKTAVTILGGFSYAMTAKDPDRQKAAWKFIQFMTSPDNMGAIDEALGQLPVRNSIWKTNAFFSTDPLMQKYKVLYDGPMQTRPSVPIYPAISAAISTELSDVVAGNITPQDAVTQARDAVLAEYNRMQDH